MTRPALFESADHRVGKPTRELAFEAVSRPGGPVAVVQRPRGLVKGRRVIIAVFGRPEPRRAEKSGEYPSVLICVICGLNLSLEYSRPLAKAAVQSSWPYYLRLSALSAVSMGWLVGLGDFFVS